MQGSRGRWKATSTLYPGGIIIPITFTGTPTNGTNGTGAGRAGIGSIGVSTTTGAVYTNTGTKASPVWTQIAPGGGGSSTTLTPLTAAQITTLHSVPVTIVADPGVGNVALLEGLFFEFIFGTVQFTGGGAVTARYHGGAGANLMSSSIAAADIQGGASFGSNFIGAATADGQVVGVTNAAIELVAAGADFAAGDSTAKAFARTRVIAL